MNLALISDAMLDFEIQHCDVWFLAQALRDGRVEESDRAFASSLVGNYLRGSFSAKQERCAERLVMRAF